MPENISAVDNDFDSAEFPVRPVIITDRVSVEKYFSVLRGILFGLSARGISSKVVLPSGMDVKSLLLDGVEIFEYPAIQIPLMRRQNRRKLLESLEPFKPTVVHCFGESKWRLAKFVSSHFSKPAVISLNSVRKSRLPFLGFGSGFKSIIVPSQSMAEPMRAGKGKTGHLVKCVRPGTFVDEACACFCEPGRLPSMIMVDDIDDFKRFEPFLCALRHLAVNGYEFLSVIMGRGKARRDIQGFVKGVGLGQIVNVAERVGPLRHVFRGTDIYIQPREVKGFSPELLEAASAGLAMAVCKADMGKFLRAGQTAVFFDPKDELSIYSTLQKLLDDRSFARRIASGGQDYLRSKHTVSDMIDELVKIYRNLD